MLYGTERQKSDVLNDAIEFAKTNNMHLVYGAMVGSVSRGVQYADSDYDTRFLYVRKDFDSQICIPSEMREDELVFRYYPENKIYEWIPFWELTSFLYFLYLPSFKNDFSVGLYNIVGWTLQSPYTWDPFGLKCKLVPIMQRVFKKDYKIAYHLQELKVRKNDWKKKEVITRQYLDSIYSASTIEWSIKFNEHPPIDIITLLLGLNHHELAGIVKDMLEEAREGVREYLSNHSVELGGSCLKMKTPNNEVVSDYLSRIYAMADDISLDMNPNEDAKMAISSMIQIIKSSVFEQEELLYDSCDMEK